MNRIDYYKEKRNLRYKDIAEAADVSPAYVHMLAKGKRMNPSREMMEKIAKSIGKSVQEVFFPKEPKNADTADSIKKEAE